VSESLFQETYDNSNCYQGLNCNSVDNDVVVMGDISLCRRSETKDRPLSDTHQRVRVAETVEVDHVRLHADGLEMRSRELSRLEFCLV
jgi:hypothetical protein